MVSRLVLKLPGENKAPNENRPKSRFFEGFCSAPTLTGDNPDTEFRQLLRKSTIQPDHFAPKSGEHSKSCPNLAQPYNIAGLPAGVR
jgi:hypothetical protein